MSTIFLPFEDAEGVTLALKFSQGRVIVKIKTYMRYHLSLFQCMSFTHKFKRLNSAEIVSFT